MKIEYRTGDLFDDPEAKYIIHCCNAMGRARSGFAKAVRDRYPEAFVEYEKESRENGLMMSQIIPYTTPDGRIIFNLIGQKNYGYDGKRYVSYDAIAKGFEGLDEVSLDLGMSSLFMPLIGSGLAGGSWRVISSIVETYSINFSPVVYLLDGKIPQT